jgi:hypothetical protein
MSIKTYLTDAGRIGNGFHTEAQDCAVRAYSIAFQIPYYEAHKLFSDLGRKNRHGVDARLIHKLIPNGNHLTRAQTLTQFFNLHNVKGRYFCYNRNHAFTLIDGIVFDDQKHTGKTRIYWYVEVTK